MMLGRVDEVDGHYVATKFFAFVIPTGCMYIPHEDPRSTKPGFGGEVRLRMDARTVGIAYARIWFPIVAFALPVASALQGGFPAISMAVGALLVAVSIAAWRSGSLTDAEKQRLRLLGTVTGLRLAPARLQPQMRETKRESLGALMEKGGIPLTPDGILSVIDDIPVPALPLVYGYARYAGDTPDWVECANHIYARHEAFELV
jgi:hypothetical protein